MRRIVAIVLAAIMSGCVRPAPQLPRVQTLSGPDSTYWGALRALPRGQFIFVTVDGGETRGASLYSVSDSAVTLWYDGYGPYAIQRASVTHVVARVQIGEKEVVPWRSILTSTAAVIGGLVGLSWGGDHNNKIITEISGPVAGGAALGLLFSLETDTKPVYEDRLVYIRP